MKTSGSVESGHGNGTRINHSGEILFPANSGGKGSYHNAENYYIARGKAKGTRQNGKQHIAEREKKISSYAIKRADKIAAKPETEAIIPFSKKRKTNSFNVILFLFFSVYGLKCYTDIEGKQIKTCREAEGYRTCFTKYNDSKSISLSSRV